VRGAVREMGGEEPETSALILVEHEVLAHEANGLDRIVVELARAADRHPVAAQELAHRRPRPDLGEKVVFLGAQHAQPRCRLVAAEDCYWNLLARQRRLWHRPPMAGFEIEDEVNGDGIGRSSRPISPAHPAGGGRSCRSPSKESSTSAWSSTPRILRCARRRVSRRTCSSTWKCARSTTPRDGRGRAVGAWTAARP